MEPRLLILPRETERLILRTPISTDAAAIQEAIEGSFIDLHNWMDWATTLQSLDDTKTIIERHQVNYKSGEDFTIGTTEPTMTVYEIQTSMCFTQMISILIPKYLMPPNTACIGR